VTAQVLALIAGLAVACGGGSGSVPAHLAAQGAHETDEGSEDVPPAAGREFTGRASYYHDSLAGNRTASGERYDPTAFTAASRTLPFGTELRVTRVDTGATVDVRVNDRGPFGRRTRILDLSRAAAERLDMIRAGVVRVRVRVLRTATKAAR